MASATGEQQTSSAVGHSVPASQSLLEAGAAMVQDFTPPRQICAHLCAFHIYASDPSRRVGAHHYCTRLSSTLRQCLIYDSPAANARLIGIEYMITPEVYASLPREERKLWHSHVFEVKSGQLVMPQPRSSVVPTAVWEVAETREMEELVGLYGKTWHLWQVDRGDEVPLGRPELMMAYTQETEGVRQAVEERDERLGTDWRRKREARKGIEEPDVHEDSDCFDKCKLA